MSFEVVDLGIRVGAVVLFAALGLWMLVRPRSWVRWQAGPWLRKYLVVDDPVARERFVDWQAGVAVSLGAFNLVGAAGVAVLPFMADPDSLLPAILLPLWLSLAAAVPVEVLVTARQIERRHPDVPMLARDRKISVEDYTPSGVARLARAVAGMAGLSGCLGLLAIIGGGLSSTPVSWLWVVCLLAVPLAAGVHGSRSRRLVALSEPAADEATRYWQDAQRAGAIRSGWDRVVLAGTFPLLMGPMSLWGEFDRSWHGGVAFAVGTALTLGALTMLVGQLVLQLAWPGMRWTRRRLWPDLPEGWLVYREPVTGAASGGDAS